MKVPLSFKQVELNLLAFLKTNVGVDPDKIHFSEAMVSRTEEGVDVQRGLLTIRIFRNEGNIIVVIASANVWVGEEKEFLYLVDWHGLTNAILNLL